MNLLLEAEGLLRGERAAAEAEELRRALPRWTALGFLGGLFYGAVMGSFNVAGPPRLLQMLYSALKMPLLLGVTFALSLPSFFVLNTLVGVRGDFPRVLRALGVAQVGMAVVLIALAPFTLVWYASTAHHQAAILFNAAMFSVASLSAQLLLRREYAPLIARDPRHRWLLRVWLIVFAFVGIQLGWLLRPFVGDPHIPTQFFRPDSWGNAYEVVGKMIWRVLTSG